MNDQPKETAQTGETSNVNPAGAEGQAETAKVAAPEIKKIEMTEEEFKAHLQAETDRRVTQALKTREEKLMEDFKAKLETETKEAARMAKLSEEERAKELFKKQQAELEVERARVKNRELELMAIDELNKAGLDIEFKQYVLSGDEEGTKANIAGMKSLFDKKMQAAIDAKFKESGRTPEKGAPSTPGKKEFTPEDLKTPEGRKAYFATQGAILKG